MDVYDMRRALNQARSTINAGHEAGKDMLSFVAENVDLRKCNPHDLERIKRQLRDFNIKTGRWKDE